MAIIAQSAIKAVAVFALVAGVSLVGYLYLQTFKFYPVVQVDLPEGIKLTAVLREARVVEDCQRTTARFLTPFKKCTACKVLSVRCDRRLVGLELALRDGRPISFHTVVGGSARLALEGPPELARLSCEAAAAEMISKGLRSATCLPPQTSVSKS